VLGALSEGGVYDDPQRGWGVRPGDDEDEDLHWANFDVPGYIECGTAGAFGDDGMRELSGGEDAEAFSWEDLHNFFDCGRSYE
jgi:hypothetical protein